MYYPRNFFGLLVVLFIALSLNQLCAQTWNGNISDDWAEPTNWSTGVVPTAVDDVIIPNQTTNPVIKDGTLAVAMSIVVEDEAIFIIENGASLTIEGSSGAGFLNNGDVQNHGAIFMGTNTDISGAALRNQGSFINFSDGTIEIDGTNNDGNGIRNTLEKTFINEGSIIVGLNRPTDGPGIFNAGNFINNAGGYIQVEEANGKCGCL